MGRLFVISLVIMLSMTSCATNQGKNEKCEQSVLQPKPLDDVWSKSLVGEWEGRGESDVGKGKGWVKIEIGLNGQFLIKKGRVKITEITPEQKQYLKETMHVSDEDIAKFQGSTFRNMEIYTIDLKTGEIIGYLFDSMRCVAKGTGKREGNKEIMDWQWSAQGQGVSRRVTEKVNADKFIVTEKYTMPNGSIMEDKWEMIRKK